MSSTNKEAKHTHKHTHPHPHTHERNRAQTQRNTAHTWATYDTTILHYQYGPNQDPPRQRRNTKQAKHMASASVICDKNAGGSSINSPPPTPPSTAQTTTITQDTCRLHGRTAYLCRIVWSLPLRPSKGRSFMNKTAPAHGIYRISSSLIRNHFFLTRAAVVIAVIRGHGGLKMGYKNWSC